MSDSSRSPDDHAERLRKLGVVDAPRIELDIPAVERPQRPLPVSHLSTPAYQSPLRHHRRASSRNTSVKETLNAKSHYSNDEDGAHAVHRLNQYTLGQEIGRGSFGCVRLAKDQYGNDFAVKEFSKSRLRKRAKSNLLRRPGARKIGTGLFTGFMSPLSSPQEGESDNAFDLIKSEIAVMKKLDHPNLVSLIEVLDDPDEDSLYMVLELCKKGVVMKVDLDSRADPYNEDTCRLWFRDLVLGLEYLHAQGIIHRDLKPDNCLITEDDVLKIVDFGVSEMFDKTSDMSTSKSSGSPAFMPPELCVAHHGTVSGRAVDIWSMGVTLYCLKFGRIPFERENLMELYEAVQHEELSLDEGASEQFCDLIRRLLDKDPEKRIKMAEIREHRWVTANGTDPLLSEKENCNDILDEPTEHEIHAAITSNMGRVFAVARAVKQFKKLIRRKRPEILDGILGHSSRYVDPPASTDQRARNRNRTRSQDTYNRRPLEYVLAAEGVHHELDIDDSGNVTPHSESSRATSVKPDPTPHDEPGTSSPHQSPSSRVVRSPGASRTRSSQGPLDHPERHLTEDDHARGHAHDPILDTLYLNVGSGPSSGNVDGANDNTVCESPGAVDDAIYEKAYEQEMKRIIADRGKAATMFLTRRVDHRRELRELGNIVDDTLPAAMDGISGGVAGIAQKLKAQHDARDDVDAAEEDADHAGEEMDKT